ncbi:MAG TPA: DUF2335 domain-containing protein [Actinomycetales bacterium]|nr:DUF2335 domain-containing protein [Actinomycetales bacterium]
MGERGEPLAHSDEEQPEQQALFEVTQAYQGPIPHPEFLGGYENVLPGSADRILRMAEESQRAAIEAELTPIRAEAWALKVATVGVALLPWFLFLIAGVLVFTGNEISAIIAAAGGFLTGGPQVIASTRRPRQRKE